MKLVCIPLFCVLSIFSMDLLEKKQMCILNHQENIQKLDISETIPLINPDQLVIEINNNNSEDSDKEEKPTTNCCSCNKTKAAVIISALTTSSVAVVALITGLTTIIVAIINK